MIILLFLMGCSSSPPATRDVRDEILPTEDDDWCITMQAMFWNVDDLIEATGGDDLAPWLEAEFRKKWDKC